MIIGVPKEIKNNENRVAMTPAGVQTLAGAGHTVLVETNAGAGSGFPDDRYRAAGARIVSDAQKLWESAEMIVKVKEPIAEEYKYFRPGLILFAYLHLAAAGLLIHELMEKEVTAIAYETIQLEDGSLPLLAPMSEVAGRMSIQIGAHFLEKAQGGRGLLLGGVPGVEPGNVVIIGGGIVGANAAQIALGMRAKVTILENNPKRLRELDEQFQGRVQVIMSNAYNIAKAVSEADLLIGAVLLPGAKAPRLVTEEMVSRMKPGSVIVDVAVDQGGCIETVDRVTTHDNPTYLKHGVVHYCVANIPGAVPHTSTLALTNVTLPYVVKLANKGVQQAIAEYPDLRKGVNVMGGKVTHEAVAATFQLEPCTVA
ncbi:alanine dehydrogenase [Effusibacillus lacus]|uniref:Alanine dehydrogenase n=1 Tax=Effusibacillus lacus TaxID=1348429 RepID=A0A292YID0_9BACL|nr:alanine dehydrogenase [Effusibacillus lacus]TCS74801.1 L-alanine dehydrogenase [Effusibacillus lacus]GAX88609.1 Alanine dehydrogenase [Effusibacillus lacus]